MVSERPSFCCSVPFQFRIIAQPPGAKWNEILLGASKLQLRPTRNRRRESGCSDLSPFGHGTRRCPTRIGPLRIMDRKKTSQDRVIAGSHTDRMCNVDSSWNPKQPERNGCFPKQPFPMYIKDFNCHIGTTICFWLFGVPG